MAGIIALGSCDYDDSNDIDIITPVDSTATGIMTPDLPNWKKGYSQWNKKYK